MSFLPSMTFDDFAALCTKRHSIRTFAEKPVQKEEVFKLLEVARVAPSVENTQPWHFHIVENRSLQRALMEACCYGNFIEGAGIFIVITCNSTARPSNNDILWNPRELEYSCITAMEHLLLGATAMGLASCFVSLHHGTAHELLKLKPEQTVIGGVMLGYPADEASFEVPHNRKPVSELFTLY